VELEQLIDAHYPLVHLGMSIDWASFEEAFGATYHPTLGVISSSRMTRWQLNLGKPWPNG